MHERPNTKATAAELHFPATRREFAEFAADLWREAGRRREKVGIFVPHTGDHRMKAIRREEAKEGKRGEGKHWEPSGKTRKRKTFFPTAKGNKRGLASAIAVAIFSSLLLSVGTSLLSLFLGERKADGGLTSDGDRSNASADWLPAALLERLVQAAEDQLLSSQRKPRSAARIPRFLNFARAATHLLGRTNSAILSRDTMLRDDVKRDRIVFEKGLDISGTHFATSSGVRGSASLEVWNAAGPDRLQNLPAAPSGFGAKCVRENIQKTPNSSRSSSTYWMSFSTAISSSSTESGSKPSASKKK